MSQNFAKFCSLSEQKNHLKICAFCRKFFVWLNHAIGQSQTFLTPDSPHLLLPKVYQEIKDLSPARSQADVPRVSEWLLPQFESISALHQGDGKSLPADVTQVIFNTLNLNLEEQKAVLLLLQDDRGVSISVMREYIADRFETYEMLGSALPSPPSRFKPPDITANSATTQVSDKYEDEDGEYEDDEEQSSDSNDEANNVKPNEVEQTGDNQKRYVNPICLFC